MLHPLPSKRGGPRVWLRAQPDHLGWGWSVLQMLLVRLSVAGSTQATQEELRSGGAF